MQLIEINFTTYIPTTLLGLLGLVSGYLFFFFRNKNDNKLKEIQSADAKDRIRAIEMSLNELGVSIDTSNLDASQKFLIIRNLLQAKTRRYLIISITSIIFAVLVTFLIWNQYKNEIPYTNPANDSLHVTNKDSLQKQVTDPVFTEKALEDSVANLPALVMEESKYKYYKDKQTGSSTNSVAVAVSGEVKFQYSDGKTYLHVRGYNHFDENFVYSFEIELQDKNFNTLKLYTSSQYVIDAEDQKLDFKEYLFDISSIRERLKVKRILIKMALE